MKLKLVTFEKTTFHKDGVFRIIDENGVPLKTLSEQDLMNSEFLCLANKEFCHHIDNEFGSFYLRDRPFVSSIHLSSTFVYYVDDVSMRSAIPVKYLKELYLIEKEI